MLHEMIHAIECLGVPGDKRVNKSVVHGFGFTGHGPTFREIGRNVQRFVSSMLRMPDLDVDVRAGGASHELEIDVLISLDPSGIEDVDEWKLEKLEGISTSSQ